MLTPNGCKWYCKHSGRMSPRDPGMLDSIRRPITSDEASIHCVGVPRMRFLWPGRARGEGQHGPMRRSALPQAWVGLRSGESPGRVQRVSRGKTLVTAARAWIRAAFSGGPAPAYHSTTSCKTLTVPLSWRRQLFNRAPAGQSAMGRSIDYDRESCDSRCASAVSHRQPLQLHHSRFEGTERLDQEGPLKNNGSLCNGKRLDQSA